MTNTFDNLDKYIVKFTQIHIFAGHLTVLWEAMVWCRTAGGCSDARHKSPECSTKVGDGFHRQTFSMMITRIFHMNRKRRGIIFWSPYHPNNLIQDSFSSTDFGFMKWQNLVNCDEVELGELSTFQKIYDFWDFRICGLRVFGFPMEVFPDLRFLVHSAFPCRDRDLWLA